MKNPDTIENEVDRIRLSIYEKTKDMTIAQRVARTNRIGKAIAKQYGIKIVPSAKYAESHTVKDKRRNYAKRKKVLYNGMTFDELSKKAMDSWSRGKPKKTPNTIEDDIDRIRLQIYEETKNMTGAQYVEHINKSAEAFVKRCGYKLVPSAKHKGCHVLVKDKGNDYTQWREDLFEGMTVEELSEKAMDYRKKMSQCDMLVLKEEGNEYGKKQGE